MTRASNFQVVIDGRYIQDHFPGIGRYTYNLIDALARAAPDERFVVFYNPALRNTRYDIAALARDPNVELRRVDIATFSLAEQYRLPFAIRDLPLAIFHSPYYIKPYFSRTPSIVTLFDVIPLRVPAAVPGWRARQLFRVAATLATRTAARVMAPSQATCDDLIARLHVPRDKIVVTPLAADARFAPQSQTEITRVRAKYNLPARYLLSVGVNKPHKNLATLVSALELFAVHNSPFAVPLVIAGAYDPRYPVTTSNLEPRKSEIVFLRDVPDADLPALYAGATVFVFPSLYEGFGLPPLEAMACGAPVVCSNASSLPEVVGDAAVLVDARNVQELGSAIARVLDDAALRDELRAKGIAQAAKFSWERTARETLNVYKQRANRQ